MLKADTVINEARTGETDLDFPFTCLKCNTGNPQPYVDDGKYSFQCTCGTKNAAVLRKEKFEVLFDFGALAFLDGYHREAVANFAAAFERFLEFFVRTIWSEKGLDDAAIERTWKLMASQSERQIGAFSAVYVSFFGESPDFLKNESLRVDFRNAVIHKGKIPTREEVEKYAANLFEIIKAQLMKLGAEAGRSLGRNASVLAREHGAWADKNGHEFCVYAFDGLLGVARFLPSSLETEREGERMGGNQRRIEIYSTKLGFSASLAARRMFLEACFARPAIAPPSK
ncbi:hypothetical protein [Myxococcus eversor]|uniref:hypothetical protein n=1 Tax=Myxococcus eversor TaxID=2709661 RepID=UPI0013D0F733|nr:hypothetical protein [Myxococcus eversor]